MTEQQHYCITHSNIIYDCFDHEVVIVNLESGTYYSLQYLAAAIWQCLLDGGTADTMLQAIGQHYSDDNTHYQQDMTAFIEHLLAEQLIKPTQHTSSLSPTHTL